MVFAYVMTYAKHINVFCEFEIREAIVYILEASIKSKNVEILLPRLHVKLVCLQRIQNFLTVGGSSPSINTYQCEHP